MRKQCRSILVALMSSLVLISCTQGKRIEHQILRMCERAVLIDTDSMVAAAM